MARLAESVQMADWLSKEEDFQLEQERNRAVIRIKEKRAKAVDFLALNLRYVNPISDEEDELTKEGLEIDLDEPYNIVDVRIILHLPGAVSTDWATEPHTATSGRAARRHRTLPQVRAVGYKHRILDST